MESLAITIYVLWIILIFMWFGALYLGQIPLTSIIPFSISMLIYAIYGTFFYPVDSVIN